MSDVDKICLNYINMNLDFTYFKYIHSKAKRGALKELENMALAKNKNISTQIDKYNDQMSLYYPPFNKTKF